MACSTHSTRAGTRVLVCRARRRNQHPTHRSAATLPTYQQTRRRNARDDTPACIAPRPHPRRPAPPAPHSQGSWFFVVVCAHGYAAHPPPFAAGLPRRTRSLAAARYARSAVAHTVARSFCPRCGQSLACYRVRSVSGYAVVAVAFICFASAVFCKKYGLSPVFRKNRGRFCV